MPDSEPEIDYEALLADLKGMAPAKSFLDIPAPRDLRPEESEGAQRARSQAQDIEFRRTRLIESGIPLTPELRDDIARRKYQNTRAVAAVMKFLADEPYRVLFLAGSYGSGKTFAASVGAATERTRFTRASALVRELNPPGFREPRPEVRVNGLWVLDDLGTEEITAKWREAFFEFVDARQFYGKTIITTNLGVPELRARYDARINDRLRACAKIVTIAGRSLRGDAGGGFALPEKGTP